MLFDAPPRGRYATDASIYQIEPVGVFVPRSTPTSRRRWRSAARRAADPAARRRHQPVRPDGGPALVIDYTKHLREVVAFDADARTVTVEPGIVLDHAERLAEAARPVVSGRRLDQRAGTLGGMAGNNSCGSRSIPYGNMVHNVLAIDALLADGTRGSASARCRTISARDVRAGIADLVQRLRAIGARERDEIARACPKVLRRVGGYNLDVSPAAGARRRRQRQPRAPAGRQRGHAGLPAR